MRKHQSVFRTFYADIIVELNTVCVVLTVGRVQQSDNVRRLSATVDDDLTSQTQHMACRVDPAF